MAQRKNVLCITRRLMMPLSLVARRDAFSAQSNKKYQSGCSQTWASCELTYAKEAIFTRVCAL